MIDEGSFALLAGIVTALDELVGEGFLVEVAAVVTLLDEFNGFAIGTLVTLVDTDDPTLTGECLSEVVQLEVLVAGIGISHVIIALRFAIGSVDFPCAVVAEFVHEAVLHAGKDHVVNTIAVLGDVIFFVDVGVDSTTNTHHP